MVRNDNESFYLFFQDMKAINGFKGFVGYSIRELSSNEMNQYCNAGSSASLSSLPLIKNQVNFTSDFMIFAYSSGCYYYDVNSGKWSSHGMELHNNTNLDETYCSSYHLTSFASGLKFLPSAINFEYVFANGSFLTNPIIYSTVIAMACLYVLFAIWARYKDKQDLRKYNILPLIDNFFNDHYLYELTVHTGTDNESGTESEVKFFNIFLI
jgi:hypothetical protein